MSVGGRGSHATPRGPLQKPELQEIGLVNVHNGISLFADRSGDRVKPNWSAAEFDNGCQDTAVDVVETKMIDLEQLERSRCHLARNRTISAHLSKIAHPAQEPQRNTWCPARPATDFSHALFLDRHFEQPRTTPDDLSHRF